MTHRLKIMADVNIGSDALLVTTLNDNDRVTITREATDQQVATMKISDLKKHIVDFIPYIGANRCKVTDFSLYANSVGNIVIPNGFAKYNPLFEVGKTYIISGYTNGEPTGQIQIQTASGYTNYNFNTPFTIMEEVINLYFRGIPNILNTFSKIKIEEGTKATPFIPGDTASIIDYTLEEQIVPGEFWIGQDGIKRQVYMKTFIGNTPDLDESSTVGRYVYLTDFFCDEVEILRGIVGRRTAKTSKIYGDNSLNTTYYWDVIILGNEGAGAQGKILLDASYSSFRNMPYSITIKYTKAL